MLCASMSTGNTKQELLLVPVNKHRLESRRRTWEVPHKLLPPWYPKLARPPPNVSWARVRGPATATAHVHVQGRPACRADRREPCCERPEEYLARGSSERRGDCPRPVPGRPTKRPKDQSMCDTSLIARVTPRRTVQQHEKKGEVSGAQPRLPRKISRRSPVCRLLPRYAEAVLKPNRRNE